eukprot:3016265-Pyramimonas_sp.AAC.1
MQAVTLTVGNRASRNEYGRTPRIQTSAGAAPHPSWPRSRPATPLNTTRPASRHRGTTRSISYTSRDLLP